VTDAQKPAAEKPATPAAESTGQAADSSTKASVQEKSSPEPEKAPEKKAAGRNASTKGRDRGTGSKVVAGANAVRSRIASLVWLVAVVCALFLAVGALMVALKMNQDNAIVAFVIDGAKKLDFGEFKTFTGKDAAVQSALTNWGIAAIIYLVVGKVADRIIRP
jgi:hypothetical protein